MRNFIAIAVLVAVICTVQDVHSADEDAQPLTVIDQIKQVMEYTSKLTNSIKQLLNRRKNVTTQAAEQLKELGGNLGNTERDLSEQMANLGEFLGIPKPPPPPKE
ncbi:unnamed protein product [Allacma fusca]|uniref:Uncharacterized protein n=1 Tax=Allacma fusca TaxID=39272 RepID=A0A8J2NJQ4_9HEXA|nr:unnamed protein product [Allacma fusca]